jgi:hypothetical protein
LDGVSGDFVESPLFLGAAATGFEELKYLPPPGLEEKKEE